MVRIVIQYSPEHESCLPGNPKAEAAFHIAGPRAQGLHHIANEFASRHAWTTPHDAYSAYPAFGGDPARPCNLRRHIWNSSAGLAPSIASRR